MKIKYPVIAFLTVLIFLFQLKAQNYSWGNLPVIATTSFKSDTFNILKYGAKPGGLELNTASINNAIDDCSKKGGGVVLISAGLWLTGPIVLKSNVDLHLDRAAIVEFTKDKAQYPLTMGNWEGHVSPRNQSPLSATDANNIAITGKGVFEGNGDVWRAIGKDRLTESEWKKKVASGGLLSDDGKSWYPSESFKNGQQLSKNGGMEKLKSLEDFQSVKDFLRPNLLVFTNCKKVLLEGVTFQNSPAWCLHPLMCQDLTVRNVYVKNPEWAQNGDGIDIESCKNVLMEGCTLECGDDGICIKSGRDEEGRKRAMPTENAVIRNNIVYHAHGGFVIGSEMSGGARNIFVYNCSFMGTDKGLRFKTARGRGGLVENIYCKDIFMKDIVGEAIYFDMYYFTKPPKPGEKVEVPKVDETTPRFQNFYVDNISCDGAATGIFIRGLPEMSIKNINIGNVVLQAKKGIELIEAENINLKNIQLKIENTNPVVYVENSTGVNLNGLKYNPADLLFNIYGERTKNIKVTNVDAGNAKTKASFTNGATENMLEIK